MAADRKVRLVAVDSQKYGSRQLRPGDEFEASEEDAEDILALGIALEVAEVPRGTKELTPVAVAPKKRGRPRKVPGPPPVKQTAPSEPKKRGRYKRRDMLAED